MKNINRPWTELAKISTDWIINIIGESTWNQRASNIHNALALHNASINTDNTIINIRLLDQLNDLFGLSLYTIRNSIQFGFCHDPVLAGRFYPFYVQMGEHIELLKNIKNINSTINKLINPNQTNSLPIFYEISVALHYAINGWSVEIIDESPPDKSPDLRICKNNTVCEVECKFLIKDFPYKKDENSNFNNRWEQGLLDNLCNIQYEKYYVDYKVPIENTGIKSLSEAISFLHKSPNHTQFESNELLVKMSSIDYRNLNNIIIQNHLQVDSPRVFELVFDDYDPYSQYKANTQSNFHYEYHTQTNTTFYGESLSWLCCVEWRVSASDAINKKLRNIRSKINEAIEQISENQINIIHVGYETSDDIYVERAKGLKLDKQIKEQDFDDHVAAIFINAFIGVSTTDNFECRETVFNYIYNKNLGNSLTDSHFLFVKSDKSYIKGFTHWDIDDNNQ